MIVPLQFLSLVFLQFVLVPVGQFAEYIYSICTFFLSPFLLSSASLPPSGFHSSMSMFFFYFLHPRFPPFFSASQPSGESDAPRSGYLRSILSCAPLQIAFSARTSDRSEFLPLFLFCR